MATIFDKTRKADIEQLRREHRMEKDPNIRRQIEDAGRRIRREGKEIASMREALLREHRRGGKRGAENIKDIHARVKKDYKYRHHKAGY
jgi:hypothetical protein